MCVGIVHCCYTALLDGTTHSFLVSHTSTHPPTHTCVHVSTVLILKENLDSIEHIDNVVKARQAAVAAVKECKDTAMEAMKSPDNKAKVTMDELSSCIAESAQQTEQKAWEEVDFQDNLRKDLGFKLSKYACTDQYFNMTESIENKTWTKPDGVSPVRVMLDRPVAQIHLIENFASPMECTTIQKAVHIKRVDGAGGFFGSSASVDIPWTIDTSPTTLATKMYTYAQDVFKTTIYLENTEKLQVLRYDQPDDRFDSHCDGECNGGDYKPNQRFASVLVYCDVADVGGATHFDNAGVHIRPKQYDAVFYSYVNPVAEVTDPGFTRTTECGVKEGTKTTVFHSLRDVK